MSVCRDISGRNNHGRYVGRSTTVVGAVVGDDDPGREFGAPRFVTADRVIRDLPALGFSFGCWMRPLSAVTRGAPLALNTRTGTTNPYPGGASNRGLLYYHGAGAAAGRVYWSFGDGPGTPHILGPVLAPATDWHLVVVTFDDPCELWVDGASVGTAAMNPANTIAPDDRFSMAQEWDNLTPSDFFHGQLDEVFMLDRVVTSGEVADLYAIGTGALAADYCATILGLSGLVGYWRLNDRGGWTVGRVGR